MWTGNRLEYEKEVLKSTKILPLAFKRMIKGVKMNEEKVIQVLRQMKHSCLKASKTLKSNNTALSPLAAGLKVKYAEMMYAIDSSIDAVRKTIPRVVDTLTTNRKIGQTGLHQIERYYICPCCKEIVGDYELQEIYDHCPKCGQALKGEKIKDD